MVLLRIIADLQGHLLTGAEARLPVIAAQAARLLHTEAPATAQATEAAQALLHTEAVPTHLPIGATLHPTAEAAATPEADTAAEAPDLQEDIPAAAHRALPEAAQELTEGKTVKTI